VKLVIFDLDNTLVNFGAMRQAAYAEMAVVLAEEGIDAEVYLRACGELDRALFQQFEQGRMTRQEYRLRRFADPFVHIGLAARDGLVTRLNTVFMDCVNDRPMLYGDVLPVLQALRHRGLRTAILTNGPSDGQRRKLKATGLAERVDHVAIGEEIGASKPLPQAYLRVVEAFSLNPDEALMVGDSPELDHDGALAAGLRALLLDRDGLQVGAGRPIIRTLADLLSLPLAGEGSSTFRTGP
jgi:HAD superfamily hydrolase (TIGR01549 family)